MPYVQWHGTMHTVSSLHLWTQRDNCTSNSPQSDSLFQVKFLLPKIRMHSRLFHRLGLFLLVFDFFTLYSSMLAQPEGPSVYQGSFSLLLARNPISLKNVIGIVMGIAFNVHIPLGIMDILAMLNFSIHEHGISFHFIVSIPISFNDTL